MDHFETVRRRKDGTFLDISLTVSPVRDALGRIIGASKTARDITEQKRIQRELALRLQESQRVNRAKDEFLAMLGHELRNPLGASATPSRCSSGCGGRRDERPRARRHRAADRHLARLVDDLLDVARVTAARLSGARAARPRRARAADGGRASPRRGRRSSIAQLEAAPAWVERRRRGSSRSSPIC